MYQLKQLVRYPVKSTRPEHVKSMLIDSFGPAFDRRFMFVDEHGEFITQRSNPRLAFVSAEVTDDGIAFKFGDWKICLSLSDFIEPLTVRVWGDDVLAHGLFEHAVDNFTADFLGVPARLVFMSEAAVRPVDPDFSESASRLAFSDGFPFLICNTASLADLNSRLEQSVPMWRFRPNIVFEGAEAFEESRWKRIRIGRVEFDVVKPCSRCSMTTLDERGRFGKEPLKTLATYRRNEYGVCFGENMVHRSEGEIDLSMCLEVLETD